MRLTVLAPDDRERWAELWRGYLAFYETELPPDMYDATWARIIDPAGGIRGHGYARALIEGVANVARERGCCRLYWSTQQQNTTARRLYDRIATFRGVHPV